jgi:CSLREA domain-containing protein
MALTTAALLLVVSAGAFAETASSPVSGGLAASSIVDNVLYPGELLQDEGPRGLIFVDTFDDELDDGGGDCSLREAIQAANLNHAVDGCPAGGVYDVIHLPAGTYDLSLFGEGASSNCHQAANRVF